MTAEESAVMFQELELHFDVLSLLFVGFEEFFRSSMDGRGDDGARESDDSLIVGGNIGVEESSRSLEMLFDFGTAVGKRDEHGVSFELRVSLDDDVDALGELVHLVVKVVHGFHIARSLMIICSHLGDSD